MLELASFRKTERQAAWRIISTLLKHYLLILPVPVPVPCISPAAESHKMNTNLSSCRKTERKASMEDSFYSSNTLSTYSSRTGTLQSATQMRLTCCWKSQDDYQFVFSRGKRERKASLEDSFYSSKKLSTYSTIQYPSRMGLTCCWKSHEYQSRR